MASTTFLGSTAAISSSAAFSSARDVKASQQSVQGPRQVAVRAMARNGQEEHSSRRQLLGLAAVTLAGGFLSTGQAKADLIEDLLAKSAANKELNDKKRLATSGANTARAYTVTFGTCKFPENFTGCEDLAKLKKVKFLSDDLEIECEGKDKYKCGSNVFWKW
eukprot:TRINITY_DN21532_c0_g1_i1.p1 TRINITY_DN21532_c0_g1~~TRINITY_DN21532_c0_g1_i1.p1  ORF type:complete len:175 (+),score=26.80 TRINITY_DN21532_c0_g1_i1:38-526(+)